MEIQSNSPNGSAILAHKYWTKQRIEPLTITFCYSGMKLGLPITWNNNQIEPLSGDSLSRMDCNILYIIKVILLPTIFSEGNNDLSSVARHE